MKVEYFVGECALRLGKIEVRWRFTYKQDRSKIKVGYNDGGSVLRSGKIKVRWRLD